MLGIWCDEWMDSWVSVHYSKWDPTELIMEWEVPGCRGRKVFDQEWFDTLVKTFKLKKEV